MATEAPVKPVDTSVQYAEGTVKPLDLNKEAQAHAQAQANPPEQKGETKDAPPPTNPMTAAFFKAAEAQKAKEAEKAPAAPVAEPNKLEDPSKFTGKKLEDWKTLRAKVEAAEKAREDVAKDRDRLSAEIEAYKKQPVIDPKELEALKAEKSAIMERMNMVALEQVPEFQAHFDKRFGDAIALAKSLVPTEHQATIEELLQTPRSKARDEQIKAIASDLDGFDMGRLGKAVDEMDSARAERKAQLANSKDILAKKQAVDKEAMTRKQLESQKQLELAAEEALKFAATMTAFQNIEGATQHNLTISERQAKVRRAFSGQLTPQEMLKLPVLAEEAQFLKENIVPALLEENKKLKESLSAMSASNPYLKGGGKPAAPQKADKSPFISKFIEKMGG